MSRNPQIRIDVCCLELCTHCLQTYDRHVMHFCAGCDGLVCVYCIGLERRDRICPECTREGDEP